MATRRTPQGGPRRGSRRDQVQRNIRPGARGTERARTTDAAAAPRPRFTNRMAILVLVRGRAGRLLRLVDAGLPPAALAHQRPARPDRQLRAATSRRWSGRSGAGQDDELRREPGPRALRLGDARRDELPGDRPRREAAGAGRRADRPRHRRAHGAGRRGGSKVYGTLEVADHPKKAPTPATRITPPPTPTPSPDQ